MDDLQQVERRIVNGEIVYRQPKPLHFVRIFQPRRPEKHGVIAHAMHLTAQHRSAGSFAQGAESAGPGSQRDRVKRRELPQWLKDLDEARSRFQSGGKPERRPTRKRDDPSIRNPDMKREEDVEIARRQRDRVCVGVHHWIRKTS